MAIIEVCKYNGGPDVFAWKYPSEELGTWTQLIVNESQEAILYSNGQALDVFATGRHIVSTDNIPLLNKIINLPPGDRLPFIAEVWYINKAYTIDIKWGTPSPIQLHDPRYKVLVPLRSFGQFGIKVSDSKRFLSKLAGSLPGFDKENVLKFFRGIYLAKFTESVSSYLVKNEISVLEISVNMDDLSEYLKEKFLPTLDEYGISLLNFQINNVNVPEDDPVVKKLNAALIKRAEMEILGHDNIQEQSSDTPGDSGEDHELTQPELTETGVEIETNLNAAGETADEIDEPTHGTSLVKNCGGCGAEINIKQKFCHKCGKDFREDI